MVWLVLLRFFLFLFKLIFSIFVFSSFSSMVKHVSVKTASQSKGEREMERDHEPIGR